MSDFYVSAPDLSNRNGSFGSSASLEHDDDDEAYDKLHRLPVPVINIDPSESPRLRRARHKISSILNYKMACEAAAAADGEKLDRLPPKLLAKSPRTPRVRTPSLIRKISMFGSSNSDQNQRMNLRVEPETFKKTQVRKLSSYPSSSMQDVRNCGKYSPRPSRMSFSTNRFMPRGTLTNGLEDTKLIFMEMIRCIQMDDCKALKNTMKKKLVDLNTILDDSSSILHEAAYKGCIKCIKTIMKNGCNISICDDSGWTPLHASIFAKQFDAVKFLLENNAEVNYISNKGWTPLHLAVFVSDLYIVHELVKSGGDPLLCNDMNVSPFQLAINLGKTLILDYFLHLECFLVER